MLCARTIKRHLVYKAGEASAHVVHVVVIVHMFAIDIGHNRYRRRQHQERPVTFISFNHHQVAGSQVRI
jgi:hypothetical protein